ncbi:MAG: hypothetical protein II891_00170 [Bacteroidales bacterium]|nr:hypothetical protein [Bacteroidales bacterium]
MSKAAKRLIRVLAIVAGVVLIIMTALQIVLNSRKVRQIVDDAAAEAIDGTLAYSRLHFDVFRSFPRLRVTLDSLSLTYPHDRFAAYDGLGPESPLLAAGRGADADTLAAFDRFTAAVNIWRIFRWQLRLSDASLHGLRVAAHAYPDSSANWNVFKPSDKEKDTTSKSFPLPPISIGPVRMGGPVVVYTSLPDTLYAHAGMKAMALQGKLRLPGTRRGLEFSKLRFDIDSLGVSGRLPADTVGVLLEHLHVKSPKKNTVDLNAAVKTLMVSGKLGYLHVPFGLDTRVSYDQKPEETVVDVPHLDLDLAYIPVHAEGLLRMLPDSNYVRAALNIKDCDLGKVLRAYADGIVPAASDLTTDARLSLAANADGWLSETSVPAVDFSLKLPRSGLQYRPMDLRARLALDVDGSMTPSKMLSAAVNRFEASTDGLDLSLSGRGSDLLGADPGVAAHLAGNADLTSLSRFLSDSLALGGLLDVLVDADVHLSEIKAMQFRSGKLSGKITSPKLTASMPYDTLSARLEQTKVLLSSARGGLQANILFDTVAFRKGDAMRARIAGMTNRAEISQVSSHGRRVPRVSFKSDNARVYFRTGDNRMGVRELQISAALQQRVKGSGARRKHFLDSLQRIYPGIPRDSLFRHDRRMNPRPLPSYLSDRDFAKKDIRVDLGPEVVDFLREWAPSAGITASRAFIATPRLPLRNTASEVDIKYDDDAFNINSLKVKSGRSDLAVSGSLKGIRRTLLGRGFLKGDFDIKSTRLNLNEMLTAMQVGKDSTLVDDGDEEGSSFVIDSLAVADVKPEMSVFVIPANIDATVRLHAKRVNYSDLWILPLDATLNVGKRCAQLLGTKLQTNLGVVKLDAFYATRTKEDIQLGADLQLIDMSAEGIIHMLPMVDDLMPALKSFQGKLGCRVSVTGQLDTMMNVIMPSLDGLIRITGNDLEITDVGELRKVTRFLFKDPNIGHIDDLAVDAIVENNQLEIYPFLLGVDRYQLALMGVQGLDGKMRYNASIIKAPLLPIKFGVNVFGKTDDMHFSIGRSKYRNGKVPVFTEELDDIQINIGDAIRRIFETGVDKAVKATGDGYAALEKRKKELGYNNRLPDGFLSNFEYQQLEAVSYEEDMKGYNAAVDAEVDAALDAALNESLAASSGKSGRKSKK